MATGKENTQKNSKGRGLLIGLVVFLALVNIGLLIFGTLKNDKQQTIILQKEEEIIDLRGEFDSLRTEFEQRVQEIASLGGDTTRMGEKMRELEVLSFKYQKDAKSARAGYKKMIEEIGALKLMLTQKDEEIALLKQANDQLNAENTVLKEEKVKLSQSVSDLTSQKKELDQKVEIASKLRAENFKLAAITKSNKERITKSKTQVEFKAKDLDRLKVGFNIADNKVAPQGTKTLFFRVLEPEGSVLYDLSSGSGTFSLDGVDVYYTAKQDILFDNKRPQVEFLYKKGTDYKKGKHTVEIYSEGALMGTSQFIVK